ncbi:MAG TPA: hypothetical protein DCG51_08295 [Erysipelotrichaceae bacterium]|nr:hypothetical protein [Erysipelotrichaceae bacterium]
MHKYRGIKIMVVFLCALSSIGLFGCGEKTVGKNIKYGNITEFYWTYSNINFNAEYQRYHFFTEDGKYMFFHEHRERKNQYGPCTEEDTTAVGTVELSEDEWNTMLDLIADGHVTKRTDDASAGSSGPWTYLYWQGDQGKYQVFEFADPEKAFGFEDFCRTLAES